MLASRNLHIYEEFFLQEDFRTQHKNIQDHWGFEKGKMFYPGAGCDIIVPIKHLAPLVSDIFFCDTDMRVLARLEFIRTHLFHTFNIKAKDSWNVTTNFGKISEFQVSTGNHTVQVHYLHFSWTEALDYFKAGKEKISFLYLYGHGGEGGSEFEHYYRPRSSFDFGPGEDAVRKKLRDVLNDHYVAIESGLLSLRRASEHN
jgi:hypothetical protein